MTLPPWQPWLRLRSLGRCCRRYCRPQSRMKNLHQLQPSWPSWQPSSVVAAWPACRPVVLGASFPYDPSDSSLPSASPWDCCPSCPSSIAFAPVAPQPFSASSRGPGHDRSAGRGPCLSPVAHRRQSRRLHYLPDVGRDEAASLCDAFLLVVVGVAAHRNRPPQAMEGAPVARLACGASLASEAPSAEVAHRKNATGTSGVRRQCRVHERCRRRAAHSGCGRSNGQLGRRRTQGRASGREEEAPRKHRVQVILSTATFRSVLSLSGDRMD